MTTCPTCRRRPSERQAPYQKRSSLDAECPDHIHDVADEGPELLEALEQIDLIESGLMEGTSRAVARTAIAKATPHTP